MKKFIVLLSAFTLLAIKPSTAQSTDSSSIAAQVAEVFKYAKNGYDNLEATDLIKAAKILITNPEIRKISPVRIQNGKTIPPNERILDEYDFFDPVQLLADAKDMAPVDDKVLHLRIKLLRKRISPYSEMGFSENDIKVKNYLIYSKNSKTIDTAFKKDEKVTLSVRVGKDLRLSVVDSATKKVIGTDKYVGGARLISFTAENSGLYQITIENTTNKPNDCYLMIEQNL